MGSAQGAQGHVKNLRKHLHRLACGAYLASALSSQCYGAARPRFAGLPSVPQSDARVADTVPVDHTLKLGGTLDDPLWLNAKPITDFRQREPFEGKQPTEETEVRILYTRHAVYCLAFVVMTHNHRELWQRNCAAT
jgi:hypothetical protein